MVILLYSCGRFQPSRLTWKRYTTFTPLRPAPPLADCQHQDRRSQERTDGSRDQNKSSSQPLAGTECIFVQWADYFNHAAHVADAPVLLGAVRVGIVAASAAFLLPPGDCVAESPAPIDLFEAIERHIGILPEARQGLSFEVVVRPAVLAGPERKIAVEPNLRAGFSVRTQQLAQIDREPGRHFHLDSALRGRGLVRDRKPLLLDTVHDRAVVVIDLFQHFGLLGGTLQR